MLVRVRACGICGTDVSFLHIGGMPVARERGGPTVALPLGHEPAGEIIEVGADVTDLAIGDNVVVNRSEARTTDEVVLFGAGPIGLGAAIWLKLRGVEHGRGGRHRSRTPRDGAGGRGGR